MSLFSRLDISDEQVSELKTLCTNYFRANAIFFHVNPTVWTIVHLVPAHTEYMKGKYGLGLALNSWKGERPSMCSYQSTVRIGFIPDGNRSFFTDLFLFCG